MLASAVLLLSVEGCSRPELVEISTNEKPALIIICDMDKPLKKAVFDKILYSDGTLDFKYKKGDAVTIAMPLPDGQNIPDQVLIIYETKEIQSGPVKNRLFGEYAVVNNVVVGRAVSVDEFVKKKLSRFDPSR